VDPYFPGLSTARLVTPQWVGEDGVEAVVVLSIDDMRDIGRYETWLRPVLECLKETDGRAPVSILTNQVAPDHPHLQRWIDEGLTMDVHTIDHPCPLLHGSDLAAARATYERCVDMLHRIPGNRPVAYRMPCCDSINSVSPRFFAEIFDRTTEAGRFLSMDSSVFNVFTADDPTLPRELVEDVDGGPRFSRYLPRDRSFVNTIENHPYPYVIGGTTWELPCSAPSDWQAQHLRGPNRPETVIDVLAGINATVLKQGVFTFVFHPHGWIRNDQLINIIRRTREQFGARVRFLSLRDIQDRLDANLLMGHPLRRADGTDNGVRVLDVDNDGYRDVVIANPQLRRTRRWSEASGAFQELSFPVELGPGVVFGVVAPSGNATVLVRNESVSGAWTFTGQEWTATDALLAGLDVEGQPVTTSAGGRDRGVRLRDLDGDGACELIVGDPDHGAVFRWDSRHQRWRRLPFHLPEGTTIVDGEGRDAGLRFVDLDEDGRLDLVFSNEERCSVHLFTSLQDGWTQVSSAAAREATRLLPPITSDGSHQGAWFHSRHLWVQNEDTASMANHVDRRSFAQLVAPAAAAERTVPAALHALHPRPGLRVECVASEPLVQDPIAFDWGADGSLWVVEMGDYPLGDPDDAAGGGRVKVLRDEDGDGRHDKATVFLSGLSFPTGVMPWRDGVLISCAPDILYAEDRDGDGRADHQTVLFTGFGTGNQQHRVNGFRWGLDNLVHGANGDSGGRITSALTGSVTDISGRDFRMNPDTGFFDAQTGQTQFGRSRDDWGNWFGGNNSNPFWHFVLPDHYIRRNPHVAVGSSRVAVPEQAGKARVFPTSPVPPRFNTPGDASRFTSACSFEVYRDDLLGPTWRGDLLVCEPSHGLVHRQDPTPLGVTFTSRRPPGEEQIEMLSSSDPWFRPTMARTGPDGAIWVCDMARLVIEHPEWIPDEWEQRIDLRAGEQRGRIYRLVPTRGDLRPVPRFSQLDTNELVAVLNSPNGVQRDMAHRLLLHRKDKAAAPALSAMAAEATSPTARLHALCILDGMGDLEVDSLRRALRDPHPGVRRHAVRLCEPRLQHHPELMTALLEKIRDEAAPVRLQLAFTLGVSSDPRAGAALAALALANADDPFIRDAVFSSLNATTLPSFMDGFRGSAGPQAAPVNLVRPLAQTAAGYEAIVVLEELTSLVLSDARFDGEDVLTPMRDAMEDAGLDLTTLTRVAQHTAAARELVVSPDNPVARRVRALTLLGREQPRRTADMELMQSLLGSAHPGALQRAAAVRLGVLDPEGAPGRLLSGWRGHGPGLRAQILDILLRREDSAQAVVSALDAGELRPGDVDPVRQQALLRRLPAQRQEEARALLRGRGETARGELVARWTGRIADLTGDPTRGRDVFARKCGSCHQLGGVGRGIGPDLAALPDRSTRSLLTAILDPNRAVESRYLSYDVWTHEGDIHSGMITEESGTNIRMVDLQGNEVVLLRKDIDELRSSGSSQMPEGLEQDMTPADLAHVLSFVQSSPTPPRTFSGNTPSPVSPRAADGALRLTAAVAEIRGASLRFEDRYGNLGYWSGLDDHATWTVELEQARTFEVRLDHACSPETAGNQAVLSVNDQALTFRIAGTESWDEYRTRVIGKLRLPAGPSRITVRASAPLQGYLMDLRSMLLLPLDR